MLHPCIYLTQDQAYPTAISLSNHLLFSTIYCLFHSHNLFAFKMKLLHQTEVCSWLIFLLTKVCNYIFLNVHFFIKTLQMLDSSECNRNLSTSSTKVLNEKPVLNMEVCQPSKEEMCMEELVTVMDILGMGSFETEEENWKNVNVNDQFETLFDEEPSLAEIQEVFQVFDENKDGYIDAAELQRILCGLCIREEEEKAYGLEDCRRMLCAFDENGDGFIDFTEFVKFMEKLQ